MKMPHHALDITLTRPLTPVELHQATRTMPLAANHDTTHLLALVPAKTPGKALNRLRHRTGGLLPIDVITTHYPDAHGKFLLNLAFPPATHADLQAAADSAGQPPRLFLELALYRALARHADEEADRLDRAVQNLLAHTTAPHLLAAVGRALAHTPGATPC
ncbi:hypothetical protein OG889_44945 [Streptomyces sp. NBC_00481]|uniref:hypothetical protein n=1 Tax=Streptomyces sp. NBC_00481 TaxID=2975755 RepID=UPI002DD8E20E|nr:hypothetical protein [Streptomyces sp. NBC_00481]WRZ01202.1 hypothetical protein OG889_44945 [Streptomyces sp. NBC_00481]